MMQVSNTPTPEAATPVEKFEHDSEFQMVEVMTPL